MQAESVARTGGEGAELKVSISISPRDVSRQHCNHPPSPCEFSACPFLLPLSSDVSLSTASCLNPNLLVSLLVIYNGLGVCTVSIF